MRKVRSAQKSLKSIKIFFKLYNSILICEICLDLYDFSSTGQLNIHFAPPETLVNGQPLWFYSSCS